MPLTQRQIFARRRVAVVGGASIVLAIAFYLPLTLLAPLTPASPTVLPYVPPQQSAAKLVWPTYGASAVGAVGYPGVLAASGSKNALPIASITKIVTTLVVLDKKPLALGETGPNITFTNADVQLFHTYLTENGKVEPVRTGLILSEFQVLQITLIASANNYAASLVNWAFGSEQAYLPVARAWLAEHGLAGTTLSDGTGISPLNTSTAADLIELGKIALANPLIAAIVNTQTANIPVVGEIKNTNNLLGEHGVLGVKTGTLDEAGACLLFAAKYRIGSQSITVVGVILGAVNHPGLNKDIVALLATVKTSFHEVKLASRGQAFATVTTVWGKTVSVVATQNSSVIVWADTRVSVLVETTAVSLAKAGTALGSVNFSVGGIGASVPLMLAKAIEDPGPLWRLEHPTELF